MRFFYMFFRVYVLPNCSAMSTRAGGEGGGDVMGGRGQLLMSVEDSVEDGVEVGMG